MAGILETLIILLRLFRRKTEIVWSVALVVGNGECAVVKMEFLGSGSVAVRLQSKARGRLRPVGAERIVDRNINLRIAYYQVCLFLREKIGKIVKIDGVDIEFLYIVFYVTCDIFHIKRRKIVCRMKHYVGRKLGN